MALYFFELNECGRITSDEEGVDCLNMEAVRAKALASAREVMCAELAEGRLCLSCHISISDASGTTVLELPFREAVTISGL